MSGDQCTCGHRFMDAEDFRDHMPCPGTEAEQVRRELKAVYDNLAATQTRCNELLEENRRLKAELALRPEK